MITASIFLFVTILNANSSGPPAGYANNAPQYRNCTTCHSGNVDEGNGSVYFSQLPSNYSLDEIYTIEVVVTGTNARGYGFQAAAQNDNGPVGQFLISSESSNLELNNSYIQQNSRTTSGSWIFEWLSPDENSGNITFSVSGLATGGSNGTGGDDVYTTSNIVAYSDLSTVKNDYLCQSFTLYKNYPNPFNPWTIIKYSAPVDQSVELNVYDLKGGLIKNLLKTKPNQGINLVQWDATDNLGKKVPAGVYLYQIKSNNNLQMKKMILLK